MKSKSVKLGLVLVMAGAFSACSTSTEPPVFYWGDYQKVVYQGFTEENDVQEQIDTLSKSIQMANNKTWRVAPGLYAQLGMLQLKAGNRDAALQAFANESTLYPESEQYMNYLIKQVKK